MDWLSALLLGVLGSIVATAIWEKSKERSLNSHIDDKALSLLQLALKLLPENERQIYEEEWFMFLCDQETALKRLFHAAMFAKAAATISAEVKILVPLAETVSRQTIVNKIPSVRFPQSTDLERVLHRVATYVLTAFQATKESYLSALNQMDQLHRLMHILANTLLVTLKNVNPVRKMWFAVILGTFAVKFEAIYELFFEWWIG